jgi:SAM-dependent methyltransferase
MPDCSECRWFDGSDCTAMPADWPVSPVNRVRACVVAITDEYCRLIGEHASVLEVGCGTWSPIQEHCERVGARWEGIDICDTYYGKPSIATRIESVEQLSFPDETFDFVIGNQTLEHWNEYGCPPQLGLWHCFRVCKTGGQILMNVPSHFHGSRVFVTGDMDAIERMFRPFATAIKLATWGRDRSPLEPVDLLPGFQYPGERSTYTLDIRATRRETLPPRPPSYRLRWRLAHEIQDHNLAFVAWKVRRRVESVLHRRRSSEARW